MSKLKNGNEPGSANVFRFNLTGLIVFCLCLIAGASFLTWKLAGPRQKDAPGPALNIPDPDEQDKYTYTRQGPWGELFTQNISLERPVEYLNDEMKTIQPPVWTFHGMNVAQVKALFVANGLTQAEAEKALAPDRVSTRGTDTLFKPSEEFVLFLEARNPGPALRAHEWNGGEPVSGLAILLPQRHCRIGLCGHPPSSGRRGSVQEACVRRQGCLAFQRL